MFTGRITRVPPIENWPTVNGQPCPCARMHLFNPGSAQLLAMTLATTRQDHPHLCMHTLASQVEYHPGISELETLCQARPSRPLCCRRRIPTWKSCTLKRLARSIDCASFTEARSDRHSMTRNPSPFRPSLPLSSLGELGNSHPLLGAAL